MTDLLNKASFILQAIHVYADTLNYGSWTGRRFPCCLVTYEAMPVFFSLQGYLLLANL